MRIFHNNAKTANVRLILEKGDRTEINKLLLTI